MTKSRQDVARRPGHSQHGRRRLRRRLHQRRRHAHLGISGIALETNDVRAHGKDERLPIESYYTGVDFYYQFVKALTYSLTEAF